MNWITVYFPRTPPPFFYPERRGEETVKGFVYRLSRCMDHVEEISSISIDLWWSTPTVNRRIGYLLRAYAKKHPYPRAVIIRLSSPHVAVARSDLIEWRKAATYNLVVRGIPEHLPHIHAFNGHDGQRHLTIECEHGTLNDAASFVATLPPITKPLVRLDISRTSIVEPLTVSVEHHIDRLLVMTRVTTRDERIIVSLLRNLPCWEFHVTTSKMTRAIHMAAMYARHVHGTSNIDVNLTSYYYMRVYIDWDWIEPFIVFATTGGASNGENKKQTATSKLLSVDGDHAVMFRVRKFLMPSLCNM